MYKLCLTDCKWKITYYSWEEDEADGWDAMLVRQAEVVANWQESRGWLIEREKDVGGTKSLIEMNCYRCEG